MCWKFVLEKMIHFSWCIHVTSQCWMLWGCALNIFFHSRRVWVKNECHFNVCRATGQVGRFSGDPSYKNLFLYYVPGVWFHLKCDTMPKCKKLFYDQKCSWYVKNWPDKSQLFTIDGDIWSDWQKVGDWIKIIRTRDKHITRMKDWYLWPQ